MLLRLVICSVVFKNNSKEFFNVRLFQSPCAYLIPQLFFLSFAVSLLCVATSEASAILKHSAKALPSVPKVVSSGQVCVQLNEEPCQWSSREPQQTDQIMAFLWE